MLFIYIILIQGIENSKPLEFNPDGITAYDKDKMFVLKQYPHKKYDNVSHCLLTEYEPNDKTFYYQIEGSRMDYDKKPKTDISDLLVDKNNDLTDEEKFAIFLYTCQTPNIYDPMAEYFPKGETGKFDCYFDYLNRAFKKLKPLSSPKTIYRGSNKVKLSNAHTSIDKFKKGYYASTTSFTSTSTEFKSALSFAHYYNDPVMFKINACLNPRNISLLSKSQNENELLYPPSSKFLISNVYTMYCIYKPYEGKKECSDTKLNKDYEEFKFVDLNEINENYGPFPVIERPTPSPTPKKKKNGCSSSDENDDSNSKTSSLILGDFKINSVYVGATSIYDFQTGFDLIKKARKKFGGLIPSPKLLHTAIWVGNLDSNDETLGAVFVYGKYKSNKNDSTFLSNDGARSYVLSLRDFKNNYELFNVKKLIPQKEMSLFSFIDEIKKKWKLEC